MSSVILFFFISSLSLAFCCSDKKQIEEVIVEWEPIGGLGEGHGDDFLNHRCSLRSRIGNVEEILKQTEIKAPPKIENNFFLLRVKSDKVVVPWPARHQES